MTPSGRYGNRVPEPITLPSGLLLPSVRSIVGPPGDPLGNPPRGNVVPNANPAVGSVGPNVPTEGDSSAQYGAAGGFGSTQVMDSSAWAGWPEFWDTPGQAVPSPVIFKWRSDVVFACIALNARILGSLPVITHRKGVPIAPRKWLENPQPEMYSGWTEAFKQAISSYQATGEAFAIATARAEGYPSSWFIADPTMVQVDLINGLREYRVNGVPIDSADVCHIRDNSAVTDPNGHSALEAAGARLIAAEVLAAYAANLARNGGIPWAVLQHKYRLTTEQANQIRTDWVTAARSRLGTPAILDADMQLKELQVAPKDMALAELQKYTDARICVLLGVPPTAVSIDPGTGSLTYQNVEMLFDFHSRSELMPLANEILGPLSSWLLPRGQALALNFDPYTEPGAESRARRYQALAAIVDPFTGRPAITVAEIRRMENLGEQPTPAGDGLSETDAAAAIVGSPGMG